MKKKPGCLGCLGYIIAIGIALMLIVYFFQNIVGFIGIGVLVGGLYIAAKKNEKRSPAPLVVSIIGLIIAIVWFGGYHNTSVFKSDEDTEIASTEVKEKTKDDSSTDLNDKKEEKKNEVKDQENKKEPTSEKGSTTPVATKPKEQTEKPKNKYPLATVTHVVDGDTIEVSLNGKEEEIRMLLIDTPETKHPSKPVEKFGPEASSYAKQVLAGKQVGIHVGSEERDKYGRLLAYVWIGNTTYQEMVLEKGLAATAYLYNDLTMLEEFHKAQDIARNKKIGVWSIPGYAHVDHDHGFHYEKEVVATKPAPKPAVKPKQPAASTPAPKGECNIKGNQSGIYHVPGGQYYDITNAEEMFCSEAEAVAAGYRKSKR
jgi:micrococcal nuclease